jgi:rod shape-determining protein MreC
VATYHRVRSTRLLLIGLLVASLVTITVDARGGETGPLAAMGRVGLAIITPLQKGLAAIVHPVAGFFGNIFRAGELAEENEVLSQQLEQVGSRLAQYTEVSAENMRLKELLGIREELQLSETIPATVIADSPSNLEWAVEVDQGSADGVEEDMAVIGPDGLVGRVITVGPSSAIVELIIDPSSQLGARIATSRQTGIITGQGDQDLRLDVFYEHVRAEVGDPIVTPGFRLDSGQGSVFPGGVQIGVVSRIESANGQNVVYVRPFTDFATIEDVLLVPSVEAVPAPAP